MVLGQDDAGRILFWIREAVGLAKMFRVRRVTFLHTEIEGLVTVTWTITPLISKMSRRRILEYTVNKLLREVAHFLWLMK